VEQGCCYNALAFVVGGENSLWYADPPAPFPRTSQGFHRAIAHTDTRLRTRALAKLEETTD
jgi:hypothetical protein